MNENYDLDDFDSLMKGVSTTDVDNFDQDNEPTPIEKEIFKEQPDNQVYDQDGNKIDNTNSFNTDRQDYIDDVLASKGIKDKNAIKFEEEDGTISSRTWDELSNEEKASILAQDVNSDSNGYSNPIEDELTPNEVNFLNYIRQHNLSPEDYIDYIQKQSQELAMEQFNNKEPQFEVNQYSDEELYVMDAISRNPELTDEEAAELLEKAQENPVLFAKQVEGIRSEYENKELEKKQLQMAELQEQQEREYAEYSQVITDQIINLNQVGTLDVQMTNEDAANLYDFIMNTDGAGNNYMAKAMKDPRTLVEMAWFAMYGKDALNSIGQYLSQEIQETSHKAYQRGLQDGMNKQGSASPRVVKKR